MEVCLTKAFLGILLKFILCSSKSILQDLFSYSDGLKGTHLEGVTSPYIYVGTWKAMFGWHKEDMDLYSINYVHTGQPKYWYGIDLTSSEDFECYVESKFRDQFKSCSEFIRHKTTLIHPENLLKNRIGIRRAI